MMHVIVRYYNFLLQKVVSIFSLLGMGALLGVILTVVGDILWRRIADQSFIGLVDITQLFIMAAASTAIPLAFSKSKHVTVDLLNNLFPLPISKLLDITAQLISLALMCFLFYLTWGKTMQVISYGDVSQNLEIPKIYHWGILLLGLLLSILVCLGKLVERLLAFSVNNNIEKVRANGE